MPYRETYKPILEAAIAALNRAHNDLYATDDGLDDAAIAALSNPGTVTGLLAAILALPWAERNRAAKDWIYSALYNAANPIFALIASVTSATGSTSGGSLSAGTYQVRVTAFDRFGNESAPTAAITSTVASGTSGSIPVVIPTTPGVERYRVYFSAIDGAAGSEDRYKESAAASGITTGNVTVTLTTTTVSGAVVSGTPPSSANTRAGYGFLTDLMVENARAAGTFANLRTALCAQHPQTTDMTEFIGADGSMTFNAIP